MDASSPSLQAANGANLSARRVALSSSPSGEPKSERRQHGGSGRAPSGEGRTFFLGRRTGPANRSGVTGAGATTA